ncbi:MAG: HAMP domain-containing histidine kinase, partial [Bacteroidales bacterium]|nr:HAMP domain-containing histidine kinase [Bacteroidales bacterium]
DYDYDYDEADDSDVMLLKWNEKTDNNSSDKLRTGIIKVDTIKAGEGSHNEIMIIKTISKKDSFYVVVNKRVKRINTKVKQLEEVFEKMVIEVEMKNELIEDRLNYADLKDQLTSQLANRGINIPFEYAVISRDDNSDTAIQTKDFKKGKDEPLLYRVNLFPGDIFGEPDFLEITFPEKTTHIYKSILWLLVGSSFFTFFMIATFSFTLFLILRQKKISEIKSDFINNMTHEFKTPLATISLASDSLLNEKIQQDKKSMLFFLSIIKEESKRMNKQVENILQMALFEKKKIDLNFELLNIHDLIRNAVTHINLQLEKANGIIEMELNAVNQNIFTDKVHFTNVIYNLIDNSIKYNEGIPQIKIATSNRKDGVLILIEDNGIGMSMGAQKNIFDRFYRATKGNVHNVKGFGLGLSYVKEIVSLNKGDIWVKSEVSKGSIFTVFLPFKVQGSRFKVQSLRFDLLIMDYD